MSITEATPPVQPFDSSGIIHITKLEEVTGTFYDQGTLLISVIEGLEDRLKNLEHKVEELYYPMRK